MGKSGMNEIEEDTTRGDETEEMKVQEHGEKNKRKTVEDKGRKASTRDVVKLLKWIVILAVVVILVGADYKLVNFRSAARKGADDYRDSHNESCQPESLFHW